ncbi:hypothetical protein AVEN_136622-1 [Araneus ventricosus]|uniref:Uncharacterized protein n=1 Tax=Araneus ventricosus TaxID=182803 RepID=A0A4Y2CCK6_ARAVE|nr:hypothetical protein AVEN_136622-1 [Araneus ventricosus]
MDVLILKNCRRQRKTNKLTLYFLNLSITKLKVFIPWFPYPCLIFDGNRTKIPSRLAPSLLGGIGGPAVLPVLAVRFYSPAGTFPNLHPARVVWSSLGIED